MAVSINEIKERLMTCSILELNAEMENWRQDSRKGVQQLLLSAEKRIQRQEAEEERLNLLLCYERLCYEKGYHFVAGVDEVGRGPLAGPVMAGAVILPENCKMEGINDSKKLTPKKREELYDIIRDKALAFGIGSVSPKRIDQINIFQATLEAMQIAISKLSQKPDFILADAVSIPKIALPQQGIIKGDAKSMSIGAASILAKVERDRLMVEMNELYPQYSFHEHKGYGTEAHIAAIKEHGLCPIHRRSFVKNIVGEGNELPHNRQKGNEGEDIAVKQMGRLGYTILSRNYRSDSGEIDIIAKKDGYTIFTEVKFRKSMGNGLPREAVNWHKQQHIINTAKQYIKENNIIGDLRFDVAEVAEHEGQKYFNYIENAFDV